MDPKKVNIRHERIKDYLESTGFITNSGVLVGIAHRLLQATKEDNKKNDGNYSEFAIPTIILAVNGLEVFVRAV